MPRTLRLLITACLALAASAAAMADNFVLVADPYFSKVAFPPAERTQTVDNGLKTVLDIFFHAGSATITPDQMPNVERIATFLRANPKARVDIKGYASCDGSAQANSALSELRAAAVRQLLISHFNIAPRRITAAGAGVGDLFEVPSWNRVSVCTIEF